MAELIRLVQSNEPLWIRDSKDGTETLNLIATRGFSTSNDSLKNANVRTEASRVSGVVTMNSLQLVDMFVNMIKWSEMFPTIVSRARTIEAISSGLLGSEGGSLQLVRMRISGPSRSDYLDLVHAGATTFECICYMGRTYGSRRSNPIDRLYRDFIYSGLAFGAKRWLACLQRACERSASLMMTTTVSHDLGGVNPSPEGKRSMMNLAQRMVNNFCSSINPSNGHQWTSLSGMNEFEVRAILYKSTDPGHPHGLILSASTTIWLPIPPQSVFDFLRDGRTRPQWDVLSNQNPVQEVANIANGTHPGNCIAVLKVRIANSYACFRF
ncbi:putative START domain-containing protein [Helianthus annuus]|nr:putative START domain-containing protein [Helianthus annuus]